jgi:hypothetical protein
MTPKEKAKELLERITVHHWTDVCDSEGAKQCALVAVDEIIHSSPSLPILGDSGSYGEDIELSKIYWEEVKQELEKI